MKSRFNSDNNTYTCDENGGYYDENGYYHDSTGGYYDEEGYYYDTEGGYYDPDGNYYDAEGGCYDTAGNYYPPENYEEEAGSGNAAYGKASSKNTDEDLMFEDLEAKYVSKKVNKEASSGRMTHYGNGIGENGKKRKKKPNKRLMIIVGVAGGLLGATFGAAIGAVLGAMFLLSPVLMGIIGAVVLGVLMGVATGSAVYYIAGRVGLVFLTFLLINVAGIYFVLSNIYKGPESAKNLMASTIQETGQLKFVNKIFLSTEEIEEITNRNSMGKLEAEVDTNLISVGGGSSDEQVAEGETAPEFDINGFEIVEISGRTYFGKLMIINDPSRVKLTTIYDGSWKEYGKTLDELVDGGNFLAGVNGGEYQSDSNKGGSPKGIVVCDGEIQYNNPYAGDVMVGFNTDNILIIRDIGGMSKESVKALVEELNIRDAVSFKDIADGDDNHFTKLIINGESVSLNGSGSGANPRTVIGQKADGTVLLFVTDGRGAGGHLGATAADIISVMQEYGAVNAANLDGGSSSCMYHDGEWEMTSVTLYYSNASWRLPLAFVVERR